MLDIVGFPLRGGAEVKPTPFFRISGTVNVTQGSSIIMTSHDCRDEIKPGGILSIEGYFLQGHYHSIPLCVYSVTHVLTCKKLLHLLVSLDPITPANFIITAPYPGPTRGAVMGEFVMWHSVRHFRRDASFGLSTFVQVISEETVLVCHLILAIVRKWGSHLAELWAVWMYTTYIRCGLSALHAPCTDC